MLWCHSDNHSVDFTLSEDVWNNTWISEGAKLVSTSGSGSTVTKKFNVGPDDNHLGFHFQGWSEAGNAV